MCVEQLRPRRRHDEQRDIGCRLHQMLDEREQRLVGPVQVLEHEYQRLALRRKLQKLRPGSKVLAPRGLRRALPQQCQKAVSEPGAVRTLGQDMLQPVRERRAVVALEDAGVRLDDLGERQEGDTLAVGQAAALAPGDKGGRRLCVGGELRHEARLPYTRLPDDDGELRK